MRAAPVVIVGAGPVGLCTALDLASHGIATIIVEKGATVRNGSRAICWAKRSLEILDRLGSADGIIEKGVVWDVGKVFHGDQREPLYTFDLLADKQQKCPAFVNLQQFHVENILIDQIRSNPLVDLRWQSKVVNVALLPDGVRVSISAPQGDYSIDCAYLVAADGHRSTTRQVLGLDFKGRVFEDHFLIVDIRMSADFPAERRFWFDPPFNPGKTALLHKQPHGIWRLDFQIGAGTVDRQQILSEENVERLVQGIVGTEIDFECVWKSLYTFQCRRMDAFVHDRVIFAGDAAHLVSPFGARGANGGIQDADNLCWKLALLLKGHASTTLLESYNLERTCAADENILNSSRSTDFLSPTSVMGRAFRDATLQLASEMPFARALVNSGRLSVPCTLSDSPLNTPDSEEFRGAMTPGAPCMDAPVDAGGKMTWFLRLLGGFFTLVVFSEDGVTDFEIDGIEIPLGIRLSRVIVSTRPSSGTVHDVTGLLTEHYDATPGTVYLIRPDQHVAARWRTVEGSQVFAALRRAIGAKSSPELTIRRTADEGIRLRG